MAEGGTEVLAGLEVEDGDALGHDGLGGREGDHDGGVGEAGGGEDGFGGRAVDLGAPRDSAVGSHQTMGRAVVWILGLGLAVVVLTAAVSGAVRFATTSTWWWERGFERFDAAGRTGLGEEEVVGIGAEVREYLVDDQDQLGVRYGGDRRFFSEREVQHMVDVKMLMERTWIAGLAAGVVLAAILAGAVLLRRRLDCAGAAKVAVIGGGLGVVIIAGLAVVAMAGFDDAFRQFHLLFFTNDLWQLTSRDRLIQLFPQRFFFETTLLIGGAGIGASLLCLVVGGAYLRRERLGVS